MVPYSDWGDLIFWGFSLLGEKSVLEGKGHINDNKNYNSKDNKDDNNKCISALRIDSKGHLIIELKDRGVNIFALPDF